MPSVVPAVYVRLVRYPSVKVCCFPASSSVSERELTGLAERQLEFLRNQRSVPDSAYLRPLSAHDGCGDGAVVWDAGKGQRSSKAAVSNARRRSQAPGALVPSLRTKAGRTAGVHAGSNLFRATSGPPVPRTTAPETPVEMASRLHGGS